MSSLLYAKFNEELAGIASRSRNVEFDFRDFGRLLVESSALVQACYADRAELFDVFNKKISFQALVNSFDFDLKSNLKSRKDSILSIRSMHEDEFHSRKSGATLQASLTELHKIAHALWKESGENKRENILGQNLSIQQVEQDLLARKAYAMIRMADREVVIIDDLIAKFERFSGLLSEGEGKSLINFYDLQIQAISDRIKKSFESAIERLIVVERALNTIYGRHEPLDEVLSSQGDKINGAINWIRSANDYVSRMGSVEYAFCLTVSLRKSRVNTEKSIEHGELIEFRINEIENLKKFRSLRIVDLSIYLENHTEFSSKTSAVLRAKLSVPKKGRYFAEGEAQIVDQSHITELQIGRIGARGVVYPSEKIGYSLIRNVCLLSPVDCNWAVEIVDMSEDLKIKDLIFDFIVVGVL